MPVFTASFAGVAAAAAQDLFEITAPTNYKVAIRRIVLGQYTDFGDAAAELLSLLIVRGHTTAGSGGTAATPANLDSQGPKAYATVAVNNTTIASAGTGVNVWADAWNVAAGYVYPAAFPPVTLQQPQKARLIIMHPGEILAVRQSLPVDSLTMNGTIEWEELPK